MAPNHVALYALDTSTWRLAVQGTLSIEYIPSHRSMYLIIRSDSGTGGTTHPIVNVEFVVQEDSLCWNDIGIGNQRVALSFDQKQDREATVARIKDCQAIADLFVHDVVACSFWFNWFQTQAFVSWDVFFRAVSTELRKDLQFCQDDLRYALGMDEKVKTVSPQQLLVFLAWFGPLASSIENMRSSFTGLSHLIAINWFHGFITRNEAIARLLNKPVGTFLVRFSSNRGCYALSYVDVRREVIHTLLHSEATGKIAVQMTSGELISFDSLADLVKHESANLVYPCQKPNLRFSPDALVDELQSLSITQRAAAAEAITSAYVNSVKATQPTASAAPTAEHAAAVRELADLIPPLFQIDASEIVLDREKPLGEGAFAIVYKGMWADVAVAVKVLRFQQMTPENKQQFRNEVQLMSELDHDNIVRWFGVCVDPTMLAIVTEFMDCGSLHSILHKKEGGRHVYNFTFKQIVGFALETAKGMEYLGSRSIIHRDLKSLNLLVDHDYHCKVCDFGLSRVKAQQTQMTGEIGTTLWMAPELFHGKKINYTEKVDVYSFGIIMWELITREEPYSNLDSHIAVAVQVSFRGLRPPVPTDCPSKEYVSLMQRCWDADPDKRPSFTEVVAELQTVMSTAQ